jgi:hypothetical protein
MKDEQKSWLCRIGIHSWVHAGHLIFGDSVYYCRRDRCTAVKRDCWVGVFYGDDPEAHTSLKSGENPVKESQ